MDSFAIFVVLKNIYRDLFGMRFFLFCICFLMPGFLFPQQEVLLVPWEKKVVISFRPGEGAYEAGNVILMAMATYQDQSPYHLQIGFRFRGEMEIRLHPMERPEITIRLLDIVPSDLPRYRGFSLDPVLVPSHFSCRLNLIGLPDSTVMRSYGLNRIELDLLHNGVVTYEIPVVEPGKWLVVPDSEEFFIDEQGVKQFRDYIALVNDYYAATALTDSLLAMTETYNPLTTYDLPDKYLLIMEVSRIVRLIGKYHFGEELRLGENDPAQFAEKYLKLDKFSRSATMTLEQQIGQPSVIRWGNNLPSLADAFTSRMIFYIRSSMLLNGVKGGIYREYIDTWFEQTGFTNEEKVFYGLLRKMYPSDDPLLRAGEIAQTVWDSYLQKIRKMINGSDNVGALMLLESAEKFRDRVPVQLYPDCDLLKTEAIKGIYASYLGIAETCIDLNKFQKAEDYIDQAGEYLAEYRDVIPVDTMFRRVFRKLFDQRLKGCDYLLGEKQYLEALDCYQLFSQSFPTEMIFYVEEHLALRQRQGFKGLFFQERKSALALMQNKERDSALMHFDNACRYQELLRGDPEIHAAMDELNRQMLPVRYQQLADRGAYLYLTYNHEEAFRTFEQMKEVGEKIGIPEDTVLNRMYLESYKYHMLNEISMATGLIWKDELERAEEYAREVETVMALYNLEADADLQSALTSYRKKIDLKVCLGVKEEADYLALRAWKNIELKQFDIAVRQLGDVRKKSLQYPECALDLRAYDDTIKKYLSAAFYLEKQQQALNLDAVGDFRNALQIVNENERFYLNTKLDQFGIPLITTLDFVSRSSKVPMFMEAIPYFLDNREVNSAWLCLNRLKQEGVDQRNTRDLQERVGYAMAAYDADLFMGSDPELRVRSYTGGNRWFAKFAHAYTTWWQQLQSEPESKTP